MVARPPSTESALLADYLKPSLSLFDLAERHNLSIPDLIAWSELPATAALLARLKAFAETRSAILTADRAPPAILALSTAASSALATSAEASNPAQRLRAIESARKSASHILRLAPRHRKPPSPAIEEPESPEDASQDLPAVGDSLGIRLDTERGFPDTGPSDPYDVDHEQPVGAGPAP